MRARYHAETDAVLLPCICLNCMANNKTGRCHGQGAATCFERRVEGQPINPPHLPECPCGLCDKERSGEPACVE
jgi:hypothetical protein